MFKVINHPLWSIQFLASTTEITLTPLTIPWQIFLNFILGFWSIYWISRSSPWETSTGDEINWGIVSLSSSPLVTNRERRWERGIPLCTSCGVQKGDPPRYPRVYVKLVMLFLVPTTTCANLACLESTPYRASLAYSLVIPLILPNFTHRMLLH